MLLYSTEELNTIPNKAKEFIGFTLKSLSE